MALIKCKECGEKVSNKAKTCPSCGVTVPKQTSLFTWLVLVLIVFGVYSAIQDPGPSPASSVSARTTSAATPTITTPPVAEAWRSFTSSDELTGDQSAYAASPRVGATRRMNFPYGDVRGWVGVGCDASSEWAYVGFTDSPNLTNTDTQSGFDLIRTRARFNDTVENVTLTQQWGASALHFRNDSEIITKLTEANSLMLELSWYGEQQSLFEFSLNGSAAAISDMRSFCSSF